MAKIHTLTSMSRLGESIKTFTDIDVPQDEAVALCRAGLAKPVDWTLPTLGTEAEDDVPDQFLISGISNTAAAALHQAGLHSITDVKNYLASGKQLGDIDKRITAAQAKKITELCAAE
jgi:hypothetical protein